MVINSHAHKLPVKSSLTVIESYLLNKTVEIEVWIASNYKKWILNLAGN